MTTEFTERARRLRNGVEPLAAGVYFAPEAHDAYAALGFDGSPAAADGVARPELKSYFTSRGACLGQVPCEVIAAAFGCFNPAVVVPAVTAGWKIAHRKALLAAREQGATAMLARVLGEQPDGLARITQLLRRAADGAPWQVAPSTPVCGPSASPDYPAELWRAADLVREHRGDSHVISWAVGGADAVEVLLLTEQWWGLPPRAYAPSRGWGAADLDNGFARLHRRGLMTPDEQLTAAGRAFREEIEVRTDELELLLVEAVGDDLDELLGGARCLVGGHHRRRLLPTTDRGGLQRRRRTTLRRRTDHRHSVRFPRERPREVGRMATADSLTPRRRRWLLARGLLRAFGSWQC